MYHTENMGLASVRNTGVEKAMEADSSYIAFIDSDDWIEENMIEALYSAAVKNKCDVVVCNYRNGHMRGHRTGVLLDGTEILDHAETMRSLLNGSLSNVMWNKLWAKSLFEGVRFPDGKVSRISRQHIVCSRMQTVSAVSRTCCIITTSIRTEYPGRMEYGIL